MKPIETEYRGNKFRSRLEARWAVFFNSMNLEYEYELEGFETKDGTRYLPDFYLPVCDTYVEVKGMREGYKEELNKTVKFVEESGKRVIVLTYVPYVEDDLFYPWFPMFYRDGLDDSVALTSTTFTKNGGVVLGWGIQSEKVRLPNCQYRFIEKAKDTMLDYIDERDLFGNVEKYLPFCFDEENTKSIQNALKSARMARFEYSQKEETE